MILTRSPRNPDCSFDSLAACCAQDECLACKTVVAAIGPLIQSNASIDVIEKVAVVICELMSPDCTTPAVRLRFKLRLPSDLLWLLWLGLRGFVQGRGR